MPANLNISIIGVDSELLISKLTKTVVSSGSACSSKDIESSSVLSGMGLSDDIVNSALRIGIGRFNSKKEILLAVEEIIKVAQKIRINA